MAKDRRKKTAAGTTAKKRKPIRGKQLLMISIAVCVVLAIVLGIVIVNAVKNSADKKPGAGSDVNQYNTTPVTLQGSVAYYIVGLLGEEETSPTDALFLLCHDKKKNTLSVLDMPRSTYLGENELWAEKYIGGVWGNPAPLDWCDTEGIRLYKAQIPDCEAQEHVVTQKVGSASYNLISVFNELYSLPIDGYFMIPKEAFVKLVDLLGGIDVEIHEAVTLGEIKFPVGVRTLDGAGAREYITRGGDSVKAELERVDRQRQVFLAIFQRLCMQTENQLKEDSLIPIMKGSTPFRTRTSQDDMLEIMAAFRKITPDKITAMVIPGEAAKSDGVNYYSVHRAELMEVLNTYFNPYGEPITEKDIQSPELASGSKSDTKLQTMDQIAVTQSMIVMEDKKDD